MNNSCMTPQWVVENFLPDYEKRYREECNRYKFALGNEISNPELVRRFIMRFFPEALLGLLKAQRDECATICGNAIDFHPVDVAGQVFNAPIPEPKNRK